MADDDDWGEEATDNVKTLSLGGDEDPEIQALQEQVDANPTSAPHHFNLAEAHARHESYDDALKCYNKAISLDSHNVHYLKQKAATLSASGDSEEAQAVLQAALKLEPNNAQLHCDLARAFAADEDHKAALHHFRQAAAADPRHSGALFQIANYLLQDQDSKVQDEAVSMFKQVISIDPNNKQAYYQAGTLLQNKGTPTELKDATGMFAKAIELDPRESQYRARLIQCHDALGNVAEREAAREALHKAFADGLLGPAYSAIGRFCTAQFAVGDKFIMAFDSSKFGGTTPKYAFNVYNRGQVHEDKILFRIALEQNSATGDFELATYRPDRAVVESYGRDMPSFQTVRESAVKIASA